MCRPFSPDPSAAARVRARVERRVCTILLYRLGRTIPKLSSAVVLLVDRSRVCFSFPHLTMSFLSRLQQTICNQADRVVAAGRMEQAIISGSGSGTITVTGASCYSIISRGYDESFNYMALLTPYDARVRARIFWFRLGGGAC